MRKQMVEISIDEYEKYLRMDDLIHRQRFSIRKLEKDLEKYKANASAFTYKTLQILQENGKGYSMKEIMLLYEALENKRCQH